MHEFFAARITSPARRTSAATDCPKAGGRRHSPRDPGCGKWPCILTQSQKRLRAMRAIWYLTHPTPAGSNLHSARSNPHSGLIIALRGATPGSRVIARAKPRATQNSSMSPSSTGSGARCDTTRAAIASATTSELMVRRLRRRGTYRESVTYSSMRRQAGGAPRMWTLASRERATPETDPSRVEAPHTIAGLVSKLGSAQTWLTSHLWCGLPASLGPAPS